MPYKDLLPEDRQRVTFLSFLGLGFVEFGPFYVLSLCQLSKDVFDINNGNTQTCDCIWVFRTLLNRWAAGFDGR